MASREGSANLTCEEMLVEICLLRFFLWWWDSALLQNSGLVLAGFSGCGAFSRGAQHVSGLSPELAVSRVQGNNHRGWGKNGEWNKFAEYVRKREWGTVQKAGMEEAEYLKAWWQLHHGSASHGRCLPLNTLSQLGALLPDNRRCPTSCLPTSFNKKTLLLHFPLFLRSPSN